MNTLTAMPNVSTPCVTTNPCTCPVYGPGGVYTPVTAPDGSWFCALALETPPPPVTIQPVPTLSEWAVGVTILLLVLVGTRRLS